MATVTDVSAQERVSTGAAIWSWITTIDHKRIGVLYFVTSLIYFMVAGFEALLIRLQLATPDGQILNPDLYNQLFTMHGTAMVFMVAMPMAAAFFNFLIPLMIGARDVAFPRLNAFSYWTFLGGSLLMHSSFLFGQAPDGGVVRLRQFDVQRVLARPEHRLLGAGPAGAWCGLSSSGP